MNPIDLTCLAAVVVAAVAGAVAGALAQLATLGAVAAGWAGATFLAPVLAPLVRERVPAFAAHPVARVAAFAACAAAAWLLLRALAASLRRDALAGRTDRALGAFLGGAKAAAVLWLLLTALAGWGRPIHLGRFHVDPAGSDLVALAREQASAPTPTDGRRGR